MTNTRPADFTDVRATNLSVVLHHLRVNGPSSRAAIAASTGLNKATVSSLTGTLIDQRLLRETGLTGNRIGRPGTALALDGSAYAAIGLQVSADRLTALAIDFAGDQLLLWHRTFGPFTPGRAVSTIITLAQRAATRVRQQGRQVLGLTVAVPGLVEESGTVRLSPPLGWSDVDLRGQLRGSLRQPGLDVAVANHARLAAVAELRHGGHPGADLIYVTGAAGIEAGIVVGGQLLHGSRGFTGQIGRFALGPAGSPTLADLAGVEPLVRRALPGWDAESLTDLGPAVDQVAALARGGDSTALTALRDAGAHLGQGLALAANLVDPAVIVLGDHYATLAEWLIPAASTELARNTLTTTHPTTTHPTTTHPTTTRLTASRLGLHAAALGGAVTHLDRIDTGTLP